MSNIPEAKRILREAMDTCAYDSGLLYGAISEALDLMNRKKPEFVARKVLSKLTWRQKLKARQMRKTSMSLHDIAVRLGTNIGRVSEALKETEDYAA